MKKQANPKSVLLASEGGGKVFIETYGCQMNVGDSEVVLSILADAGWRRTEDVEEADLILINTCAVRDNAEVRIWGRLQDLKQQKQKRPWVLIGVMGCMAERLKEDLCRKQNAVDIVAGPDSYRNMPSLVLAAANGRQAVDTLLSREETYAEIVPCRTDKNGVTAFVSIMRGCNNMCSYCVVPYTRGRERSRPYDTIVTEVRDLYDRGYKEVTLLGQNVNSYLCGDVNFPKLLKMVAEVSPKLRVRFATSHPKDLSDELIDVIASYGNICRSIHLPAQSGSSRMLKLMNRKYTREWYLDRISAIRNKIPDCAITTDLIAGFSTETEEDHQLTLSLMREVRYDFAYMFKYSLRPGTMAEKKMADDIPEELKTRRLSEIIDLQNELSLESNKRDIGKRFEVLVEKVSRRSEQQLAGRNSQNKMIVFDSEGHSIGEYLTVEVYDCSAATLFGRIVK